MTALCNTLLGVSVAYALIWLFTDSYPGGLVLPQLGMLVIGVMLGAAWLVLAAVDVGLRLGKVPTGGAVGLAVAAVVMAITVLLSVWSVPLRVRFELSRSTLERAVADGLAGNSSDPADPKDVRFFAVERGGLYEIESASVDSFGVWFQIAEPWFPWYSGFLYAPDGAPGFVELEGPNPTAMSLGDGWYAYWSAVD